MKLATLSYPVLSIRLYPTRHVFCDMEGEVYMELYGGIKTYHNRFNGWHSAHRSTLAEPTILPIHDAATGLPVFPS